MGSWKPEDTEEKRKLKEQAKKMHEKASQEKNTIQKIKLILNVITPDNYEKKFTELRFFLFGDLKSRDEMGTMYDESTKLVFESMNMEILTAVVENIFRKAQLEKEYCIFYGKIVENMIKLEISLCDKVQSSKSMKESEFRKLTF
jgi:hypothetical protein